jgi:hypothetical protein
VEQKFVRKQQRLEDGKARCKAAASNHPPLSCLPLLLGLDAAGAPHFAVAVAKGAADALAASHAASWLSARVAGPELSRQDAALMAVASGLAVWNLDTQYHGASGAKTLPQVGTNLVFNCEQMNMLVDRMSV